MDDIDSVTMAGTWKQDIVNNAVFTANSGNLQEDTKDSKQIPILLLGNKLDKVCKENGLYFAEFPIVLIVKSPRDPQFLRVGFLFDFQGSFAYYRY